MQYGGLSHSCIPICVLSEDTIPSLIRIICLWSPSHGDYLPSFHFSYKSVRRYTHLPLFSYKSVSVLYRFLILQSLSLVWI